MSRRSIAMKNLRFGVQLLKVTLTMCLGLWVLLAPLLWAVRDGLGPDSTETAWPHSGLKFLVVWGTVPN